MPKLNAVSAAKTNVNVPDAINQNSLPTPPIENERSPSNPVDESARAAASVDGASTRRRKSAGRLTEAMATWAQARL